MLPPTPLSDGEISAALRPVAPDDDVGQGHLRRAPAREPAQRLGPVALELAAAIVQQASTDRLNALPPADRRLLAVGRPAVGAVGLRGATTSAP
jgi:hypothetical protein